MIKPTIGRIVHYQYISAGIPSQTCPAIVRNVHTDGYVDLVIFFSNGPGYRDYIPYSDIPDHGCWSWPPQEPGIYYPKKEPNEA